ncbi:Cna B-type domain-containing protein, partial [Peptostreptococcus stomatis]|uniref:Cna B-type domain-containing protein n=1 Tax=Peptostreptococcus stomatis TaxID=341694 RepID=UPI003F9F5594
KGLIIKVDAPKGAFPKGTSVSVRLVSKLKDKIAYDITFRDKNNKEIQPAKGTEVRVSFILDKTSNLLPDDMPVNLKLYHLVNGVPKVIDTKMASKGFMEEKGIQSITLSGKVSHLSEFRLVAEDGLDFDKIKKISPDSINSNNKNETGSLDTQKKDEDNVGNNKLKEQIYEVELVANSNHPSIYIKGLLPKGGYATARYVELSNKILPEYQRVVTAYDIKIFDDKGKEYQPIKPVRVTISDDKVKKELTKIGRKNIQVIHISKSGIPDKYSSAIVASESKVSFNASSFSVYAFTIETRDTAKNPKEVDAKIIDFNIIRTNDENPANTYNYYEAFKIKIKWDASKYGKTLKREDFFKIKIPDEFILAHKIEFDLKTEDGKILGHLVATPNNEGGANVVVTFKDYVETHENIKGEFELDSRFNTTKYVKQLDGSYTISYYFDGKTHTHHINPKPNVNPDEALAKWANKTKDALNEAEWVIRLNFKKGTFTDVVLSDELSSETGVLPEGIKYKLDTFRLKQAEFNSTGDDISESKYKSIKYEELKNYLKFDSNMRKFTFRMSDFLKDKGYSVDGKLQATQWYLFYKSTYEKGLKLKNKAEFKSKESIITGHSYYQVAGGSGTGGGDLTNKIKIKKVDSDNTNKPLGNAKFKIVKVGDPSKVWNIITNAQGEAETERLSQGDYEIIETDAPLGYLLDKTPIPVKVINGEATIATIKNKKEEKITVKVTKKWENQDGTPLMGDKPAIRLQLLKDGQPEGNPVEFTNGKITHEWTNLDKTDEHGSKHIYTVKEVGENGYNIQLDGNWYKVDYGADSQSGGLTVTKTVTNKKLKPWTPMIPPTRDLKVTKVWKDKDNNDLVGPVEKIEVELYKDGAATGTKLDLTKANNWTGEFKKLPVSATLGGPIHKYTVKETGESGNAIQFVGKWYGVTYGGKMKDGLTVTNKEKTPWTPMIPPTRDLKVTKVWKDKDNNDLNAPVEKIEVELYKDGAATGTKLDLTKANNWTGEFKKLPVSATLGGPIHKYTVKETGESGNAIQFVGKWYGVSYGGTMADGLTVTNKEKTPWTPMIPPTRNLKVTKVWKDKDNNDLVGPVEKIEVELYKDGVATGKKLDLTKANNWTGTFEKLDVADGLGSTNYYKYTVKEVGESGAAIQLLGKWYGVTYGGTMKDGLTVTNKEKRPWTPMEPPFRNIKVEKNWNLLGREKPVEKLEVELYRDGVATGDKLELNKGNNWSGEFKKLPVAEKLGSTTYYNYTVKEVGENAGSIIFGGMQFSVNYTGDMKDGFKITNNYTPPYTPWTPPTKEKLDLKVTKLWKDSKDNNIAEPTNKIVVELYRDGKATGKRLELNKANKWTGEFTDLEAKSDSDEYYHYTIKEVGENGNIIKFDGKQYKVIYGGSMRDGITITNKKEDPPKPPTPNKPTPNKPTPNKPTPPKPNTPNPRSVLPRTGDGINPSTFAWLILALGACLSLVGYRLRKHAK